MTRKDYFLIAKAIKETFEGDNSYAKDCLLKNLIPALKADNPNFQAFRFLLACDVENTKDFL